MKKRKVVIKDIKYDILIPVDSEVGQEVAVIAWKDIVLKVDDFKVETEMQLLKHIYKELEVQIVQNQSARITQFTIVNANRFVKHCPRNMVCKIERVKFIPGRKIKAD